MNTRNVFPDENLPEEPEQLPRLWLAWRTHQNQDARDRLIEHYLPFARIMAAKLYRNRHCQEFEFDDYLQLATIGLIESIDRYQPDAEATFTTYASKRIQGAILDGAEKLNERQQQISAHQRLISERKTSIAGTAMHGKANPEQMFEQLAGIAIGLALSYMLDDDKIFQTGEPDEQDQAYRQIEMQQLQSQLHALVEQLPERERLLIKYNYFHHMPFEAIARQWQLTRGRISQLHRSALQRLRRLSAEISRFDASW